MMDVVLTIDVESYTGDYEREVHADGLGLAFIIDTCRRHGAVGTFFVEALGATRWGREPLRRIVRQLLDAGQDVQLHLHPVVAQIEGFEDREDVLCHRDRATQILLMGRALEELRACGAPDVCAFRAGDLAANTDTLLAMQHHGLGISANRDLDQKSSIRTRLNDYFPARNDLAIRDGIIDLPVTALRSALPRLDGPWRHLEIAAMGLGEMTDGLRRLAAAGYVGAGILTHPGEFFRDRVGRAEPIEKNRRRLDGVLRFIRATPELNLVPITAIAQARPAAVASPDVRARLDLSILRVWEQGLERLRR